MYPSKAEDNLARLVKLENVQSCCSHQFDDTFNSMISHQCSYLLHQHQCQQFHHYHPPPPGRLPLLPSYTPPQGHYRQHIPLSQMLTFFIIPSAYSGSSMLTDICPHVNFGWVLRPMKRHGQFLQKRIHVPTLVSDRELHHNSYTQTSCDSPSGLYIHPSLRCCCAHVSRFILFAS